MRDWINEKLKIQFPHICISCPADAATPPPVAPADDLPMKPQEEIKERKPTKQRSGLQQFKRMESQNERRVNMLHLFGSKMRKINQSSVLITEESLMECNRVL